MGYSGCRRSRCPPLFNDWAQRVEAGLQLSEAGQLRVTLRDALQPVAENVALMPVMTPAKRQQHLQVVATTAVAALHLALAGVEGRRAVVYEIDDVATK